MSSRPRGAAHPSRCVDDAGHRAGQVDCLIARGSAIDFEKWHVRKCTAWLFLTCGFACESCGCVVSMMNERVHVSKCVVDRAFVEHCACVLWTFFHDFIKFLNEFRLNFENKMIFMRRNDVEKIEMIA